MAVNHTPILDEAWHRRLLAIDSLGEVFSQLEPPPDLLESARRQFEKSGYITNPDLSARHLDVASLTQAKQRWEQLGHDITQHESNNLVQAVYAARIAEAIAQLNLLRASAEGDNARFDHYNQVAYGRPDKAMFAAACAWLCEHAPGAAKHLPHLGGEASQLFPTAHVFDTIRAQHLAPGGYFDELFGALPAGLTEITEHEGDPICRRAITRVGSDFTLQDATDGLWAIRYDKRALVRPSRYRLSRAAFLAMVGHEVGSHLAEYTNGGRLPLHIFQTGLDHYGAGNEGRAWLREQIMYTSPVEYAALPSISLDETAPFGILPSFEYRVMLHVLIGLGLGYYRHPYSFSELYAVAFELYEASNQARQPGVSSRLAHRAAWHITVRVSKGTTGLGSAFRKDMAYLEGNVRCWQVAAQQPERIMQGDQGKFDITNPQHISWYESLDIMSGIRPSW